MESATTRQDSSNAPNSFKHPGKLAGFRLFLTLLIFAAGFAMYVLLPAYWSSSSRVFASAFGYPSVMRKLGWPIEVQVKPVETRTMTRVIAADGATSYLNEIPIYSEVPGIVTEILVEAGHKIGKGQTLLYINPGGHTTRMFELRRELRQQEMEHAKIELERERRLYELDFTSKAQYENAKMALKRAETATELALEEHAHSLRSRSATVTREPPPWTGINPNGQKVEIVATLTGTVIERNVQLGENLMGEDRIDLRKPLMVIGDQLVFRANVDQRYSSLIRVGGQGKFYLRARPGEAIPATVIRVAHEVEAAPATASNKAGPPPFTFAVWLSIPPSLLVAGNLLPGMTGYALFEKGYKAPAVPESALMRYSGRTGTVMALDDSNRVQLKTVTYTGTENGWVAIESADLAEGNLVVVNGQTALKPGDKVAVPAQPR